MSREDRRKRWAFNERFVIGRPEDPLIERWRLLQTPWFGVYVHYHYREDLDRVPHDHPWSFVSLILRGGYRETYHPDPRVNRGTIDRYWRRWTVHSFPLSAAHRITEVLPGTTSFLIVGRKRRVWGFYDGFQWVDYRDALRLRPTEGTREQHPGGGSAGAYWVAAYQEHATFGGQHDPYCRQGSCAR